MTPPAPLPHPHPPFNSCNVPEYDFAWPGSAILKSIALIYFVLLQTFLDPFLVIL